MVNALETQSAGETRQAPNAFPVYLRGFNRRGRVNDTEEAPGAITRCLREWRSGDDQALERLTAAVYGELRRRAAFVMADLPGNNTIQPTALVHELYFRLPGVQHIDWQCRAQFLSVAAKM